MNNQWTMYSESIPVQYQLNHITRHLEKVNKYLQVLKHLFITHPNPTVHCHMCTRAQRYMHAPPPQVLEGADRPHLSMRDPCLHITFVWKLDVGDLPVAAGNTMAGVHGTTSNKVLSAALLSTLPTVKNFHAYFILPFMLSLSSFPTSLWNALVIVSSGWCSCFTLKWSVLSKYSPDNFVNSIHVHTLC